MGIDDVAKKLTGTFCEDLERLKKRGRRGHRHGAFVFVVNTPRRLVAEVVADKKKV